MKKLFIVIIGWLITFTSLGQGQMNFDSLYAGQFMAPIFGPDPLNPRLELHGQPLPSSVAGQVPSVGVILPAGTTVYGGALLQGTGFTLQVWSGDNPLDLAPVFTSSFRTAVGNQLPAGLVSGIHNITFANVPAGAQGWYEVRVWDNQGGTVNTWDAALFQYQRGLEALGESGVVLSQPLGGVAPDGDLYPINPYAVEWTSFNIHYLVPEPNTLALAGLGLAAVLLRRLKS